MVNCRFALALVIIAAVPLLAYAATNIGLQRTVTNAHAAQFHYGFMAAFAFTVPGVGVLASLRPSGWRFTAWVAGVLPALLGLLSLVYPDNEGSLSIAWTIAAFAWGAVFVAAAELTKNAEGPALLGSLLRPRGVTRAPADDDTRVRPEPGPATRTPRWVNGLRIIALVPSLLVLIGTIDTVTGGGFGVGGLGGHVPGPPAGGHGPRGDTQSDAADTQSQSNTEPVADGAVEIAVTADSFAFDPREITITAGEDVAIMLTSADTLHDFVIDELDAHVAAERGETATAGFRAEQPGQYTYYCSVPGHRQAGMEGTLIVEEPGDGTPAVGAGDTPPDDPDVTFTLVPIIHVGGFVEASDTSGVEPNPTLRVPLGSVVQVTLENHLGGEYDIYFPDFEAKSDRVGGGSSTSIVFVADKEGEFVYYSTVPGDREAGFEGRIVVGE